MERKHNGRKIKKEKAGKIRRWEGIKSNKSRGATRRGTKGCAQGEGELWVPPTPKKTPGKKKNTTLATLLTCGGAGTETRGPERVG